MKKKNIFMLSLLLIPMALSAQDAMQSPSELPQSGGGQEQKSGGGTGTNVNLNNGDRMFQIIVREDTAMTNTRGIKWEDNNRRLLTTDLFDLYRSTLAGKITTASTGIISAGISFIYNKIASHRQDWMQAVQKECRYTKKLSMQTEIVDFYKKPSVKGAMDPADIVFDGFGCKQTIGDSSSGGSSNVESVKKSQDGKEVPDTETKKNNNGSKDVFYVYCKLKTDEVGKSRITNHSKFEVEVDSIYFDPFICNLPNDSTAASTGEHIDFDFAKRNNLTFTLTANITSSWMNEAIQVYRDVPLGEFKVTVKINEEDLEYLNPEDSATTNKVFIYSSQRDTDKKKNVSVSGDCFIVPRSYVGTLDGTAFTSAWGTGQYKIDMQVSESCSINRNHYMGKDKEKQHDNMSAANGQQTNGQPGAEQASNTEKKETKKKKQKEEWNDNWKEEWNIIKKRQKSKRLWDNLYEVVKTEWTGEEWVTMIIEPALTTLATSGSNLIYESDTMGGGTMGGGTMGGNTAGGTGGSNSVMMPGGK